jgi:hypothetical protein
MWSDQRQEYVDAATAQSLQAVARSIPQAVGDDKAALVIGSLAMLVHHRSADHGARERDELIARVRRETAQARQP